MSSVNDEPQYDETKTPHEITCDLHDAAQAVLFSQGCVNPSPKVFAIAMKNLSLAMIAFQHVFIKGGKL
jgi:hypothetical protein